MHFSLSSSSSSSSLSSCLVSGFVGVLLGAWVLRPEIDFELVDVLVLVLVLVMVLLNLQEGSSVVSKSEQSSTSGSSSFEEDRFVGLGVLVVDCVHTVVVGSGIASVSVSVGARAGADVIDGEVRSGSGYSTLVKAVVIGLVGLGWGRGWSCSHSPSHSHSHSQSE